MHIYLPIAEISVDAWVILIMGSGIGILSGVFGVGGGFLMTPLLMLIGVPPAVAVATQANQIAAISISGVIAHKRRGNVDFAMGLVLLIGGIAGSTLGVWLYTLLKGLGQIDLVIKLSYVVFLGIVGTLMLYESVMAHFQSKTNGPRRKHAHNWLHGLPWKRRFRRSNLYISIVPPLMVGVVVGILSAIMGVGGGFIMVPAMIYILGMPTNVVVGTSLFQIIFVACNVTMLQAITNHTVDVILAALLLVGGVVGAQVGSKLGSKVNGEQLRSLMALLVLGVCGKLLFDLLLPPVTPFNISVVSP